MQAAAPASPLPALPPRPGPLHPRRRVYCARPAAQRAELLAAGPCQGLAQESVLAAALWLAIKFEGSRSAMPSAPIMYHMTGGCVGGPQAGSALAWGGAAQ